MPHMNSITTPPRTQKARGVWWLLRSGLCLPMPETFLIRTDEDLINFSPSQAMPYHSNALFARPCPARPRHGFVESRGVTDREQVLKVWAEARAADPLAELLIMPRIDAEANAILIVESGILSIGPGHDGATGGKLSVTFPVAPGIGGLHSYFGNSKWLEFRDKAGIAVSEDVYLEAVYERTKEWHKSDAGGQAQVVQARSGPAQKAGMTEYVPEPITVSEVLIPGDDLLEWETLTASRKGKPGVVCWQKGGATLACHAAIHAMTNGLAFLTRSEQPKVGLEIKPTMEAKPPFRQEQFEQGLAVAQVWPMKSFNRAVPAAIAALHNGVYLSQSKHWSRMLGFLTGIIFRAGALACLGEMRHHPSIKYNHSNPKPQRNDIYMAKGKLTLEALAAECAHGAPRFMDSMWSGSIGGKKWFVCAVETMALYQAIVARDYERAVQQANTIVNLSHNTGSFLNKFVTDSFFNEAAQAPGRAALNLAPVWYAVACLPVAGIKPNDYLHMAQSWEVLPQLEAGHSFHVTLAVGLGHLTEWATIPWGTQWKATLKKAWDVL